MHSPTPQSLLVAGLTIGLACASLAADSVNIDVLQDDSKSIVLHYDFEDFQQKTVKVGEHAYTSITLPGEVNRLDAGFPSLPRVSRSVVIPAVADMDDATAKRSRMATRALGEARLLTTFYHEF